MDLKIACLSAYMYIMAVINSIQSNETLNTQNWIAISRLNDDEFVKTSKTIMFSLMSGGHSRMSVNYESTKIMCDFNFNGQTKITVYIGSSSQHASAHGNVLSDGVHTKLWVSWINGKVECGTGGQLGMNTIVSVSMLAGHVFGSFRYVGFITELTAVWTIFQQGENKIPENRNNNFRQSVLVHTNVNIQSGMIWQQTAVNPGHCALICMDDDACRSYTFNSMKKVCRGHSGKYQALVDVTHSPEEWSEYYTYD